MSYLSDCVVCCSGLARELRDELHLKIESLGGQWSRNLTSQVTHLIAVDPRTEKYRVASQVLRIPVLLPQWLEHSPQDLISAAPKYQLPIFYGLRICVSGIGMEERSHVERICSLNGAEYAKDLTKDCTHLIATVDAWNGPKCAFARRWNICLVSMQWLEDSVDRRLCLDEQLYRIDPEMAAKSEIEKPVIAAEKVAEEPLKATTTDFPTGTLKRLRRANTSESETSTSTMASKKKPIQLKRMSSMIERQEKAKVAIQEVSQLFAPRSEDGFSRQSSFHSTASSQSQQSTSLSKALAEVKNNCEATKPTQMVGSRERSIGISRPLFAGQTYTAKGFRPEQEQMLKSLVCSNGGKWKDYCDEMDPFEIWLIVPFKKMRRSSVFDFTNVVTDCWIEACLDRKAWINPDHFIVYRPLNLDGPIAAFSDCVFALTGFQGLERELIMCLCSTLGAAVSDSFSRKNTHIICPAEIQFDDNNMKIQKAREWKIPVLTDTWLEDCATCGRWIDTEPERIEDSHAPPTQIAPSKILDKNEHKDLLDTRTKDVRDTKSNIIDVPQEIPENNDNVSPLDELLVGCVICTSTKLSHRRNELRALAMEMGAIFLGDQFDPQCTHYIHASNRVKENFKDFRIAQKKGKFIVSPQWLEQCHKQQKRLSESLYPHSYDSKRTLSFIEVQDDYASTKRPPPVPALNQPFSRTTLNPAEKDGLPCIENVNTENVKSSKDNPTLFSLHCEIADPCPSKNTETDKRPAMKARDPPITSICEANVDTSGPSEAQFTRVSNATTDSASALDKLSLHNPKSTFSKKLPVKRHWIHSELDGNNQVSATSVDGDIRVTYGDGGLSQNEWLMKRLKSSNAH